MLPLVVLLVQGFKRGVCGWRRVRMEMGRWRKVQWGPYRHSVPHLHLFGCLMEQEAGLVRVTVWAGSSQPAKAFIIVATLCNFLPMLEEIITRVEMFIITLWSVVRWSLKYLLR
jgi:hypothetical protein